MSRSSTPRCPACFRSLTRSAWHRRCAAGLGLKAKINLRSVFDRKNYFYPDLPQGYQISQYKSPIVGEGAVAVDVSPSEQIEVGIERLHLEQDAGKSLHDQSATDFFVDLNRSGIALMEIVSKPDLRSADEAKAYVTKLRTILRYLGTCDGNMEQGSLRADVNVSVRRPGEPLGTRCEIKNVNSIRFIGQAIEAEARRQIGIIEDGGKIDQETRLFDPGRGETRSMRSKEEAHDYRYFPDPDLLPLEFDQAFVDALAGYLPELPDAKKARFVRDYGLPPYDAGVLVADKDTADYYEAAIKHGGGTRDAKLVANWINGDVAAYANSVGLSVAQTHIKPGQIAEIVDLISDGTISGKIAKDVLAIVIAEDQDGDPRAIVEARGMTQVTDHEHDRGLRRCNRRRESGQGRAGTGQAFDARLVCRSGHERHWRQGQSANRQRALKSETWGLKSDRESPIDSGDSRDAYRFAAMAAAFPTAFFFIQQIFFASDPRVQLAPRDLLEDRLPRVKSILPNRLCRSKSRLAKASREITKAAARSLDAGVLRGLEK